MTSYSPTLTQKNLFVEIQECTKHSTIKKTEKFESFDEKKNIVKLFRNVVESYEQRDKNIFVTRIL